MDHLSLGGEVAVSSAAPDARSEALYASANPSHPADIEPLLGPVSQQRAQAVAALQIPDVDSAVIP